MVGNLPAFTSKIFKKLGDGLATGCTPTPPTTPSKSKWVQKTDRYSMWIFKNINLLTSSLWFEAIR